MAWGLGNLGGTMSLSKAIVIVTGQSGSTVTLEYNGKIKHAAERNGKWTFTGLEYGKNVKWTLKATYGPEITTMQIPVTEFQVFYVSFAYRVIPRFTYTGKYAIVRDDDTPIGPANTNTGDQFDKYRGHWKILYLTSGVLTIERYEGWDGHADIFLVGAGGGTIQSSEPGGGGGGYTNTISNAKVPKASNVIIGKGTPKKRGESTSFNSYVAEGGYPGTGNKAGNGGSGGGGYNDNGRGGSDGSDGFGNGHGLGQHTTTREFGEPTGKLYAGGGASYNGKPGAGGGGTSYKDGEPNTGGGAGAENKAGGSGIAIMRDYRVQNDLTRTVQEVARLENEKAQLAMSYREGVNSI